jgi:hypothetical protein
MTLYFALCVSGLVICQEEMPRELSKEEKKIFGFNSFAE